nr:hypothetical protein [uncultured Intestinibacter sp.]
MKKVIVIPNLTKEQFINMLILEALKCQDYLDEINSRDVKIITRKNLLETLIINYETEK